MNGNAGHQPAPIAPGKAGLVRPISPKWVIETGAESSYKLASMSALRYVLSPEVPGGLGDNAVLDPATRTVTHLHFEFGPGAAGDDLIECFPCYLVTEELAQAMSEAKLAGYQLADAEISTSPEFDLMPPARPLRQYRWLQVTGAGPADDFAVSAKKLLVVSQRAMDVILRFQTTHLEVEAL